MRRMGKGRILTCGDFLFIDIIHFKAGSLMMRASPRVMLNIVNSQDVIFLFVCLFLNQEQIDYYNEPKSRTVPQTKPMKIA